MSTTGFQRPIHGGAIFRRASGKIAAMYFAVEWAQEDQPGLEEWIRLYEQNAKAEICWKPVAKQFRALTPRGREVASQIMLVRATYETKPSP